MMHSTACENSHAADDKTIPAKSSQHSKESAQNLQRQVLSNIRVDDRYFSHVLADVPPLDEDDDICRICHEKSTPELPFITPCKCTGSQRYVHQSCLMQWIKASKKRRCYICNFEYITYISFLVLMESVQKKTSTEKWFSAIWNSLKAIIGLAGIVVTFVNIVYYIKMPENQSCLKSDWPLWLNCTLRVFQHVIAVILFLISFLVSALIALCFTHDIYCMWKVSLLVKNASKNCKQKSQGASSTSGISAVEFAKSENVQFVSKDLGGVSHKTPESTGSISKASPDIDASPSGDEQENAKAETGTGMTTAANTTHCNGDNNDALLSVVSVL